MPTADFSFVLCLTWLAVLCLVPLAYLASQLRRSSYSWWENCLYLPTYLMGRLMWRVQFQNSPPPAIQSGAILAANHRSSVDPFFVQLAARRRVHWMVAKEFCQHPLFGRVLRPLQVIPTNRSGMDTAATKTAMRLTGEGRLVGMFPEGRINRSDDLLHPMRSGAAVVASRAHVPIVPLLIRGSPMRDPVWSPLFMPANVQITFGTPIEVAAQPASPAATESEETLHACDEAMLDWGRQLSVLAGQPEFQVRLASARSRRRKSGHMNRDRES